MTSPKTFVIGLVGFGGLAAASMGGYLAARSNANTAYAPAVTARPSSTESPAQPSVPDVPAAAAQPVPADAPAPTVAEPPARVVPRPTGAATRQVSARRVDRQSSRLPAEVIPAEPTAPLPEPVAAVEAPPSVPAPPIPAAVPPARDVPTVRTIAVPENSVIGIRLDSDLSSETAELEDRVVARVTRDVKVDELTAIPAGSLLEGHVTVVERGGKFKEQARIGMQFTSLTVDGRRLPIDTEAIFRDGQAPMREATSKVGASAVVGTILGAVIGGKKGAAIGGAAGAAGGTAAVMAGGRNAATIAAGTPLTVRLTEPLALTVEAD